LQLLEEQLAGVRDLQWRHLCRRFAVVTPVDKQTTN